MRVLVTGAGGMLGRSFALYLSRHESWVNFLSHRSKMDVTDSTAIQNGFNHSQPDVVIHLAALTDVDLCQKEPDAAYLTNYLGTWFVAQACAQRNITMVYLSTDMVFDGSKESSYIETDIPSPLNIYGKTKLAGECLVRNLVSHHYIIRTGWMFGGIQEDHKFVGKIIEQILTGKELKVVTDRIGSPIYTEDLANKIINMLTENLPWGTYHLANRGSCTRYEFARQIMDYSELPNISIVPILSSDFPVDTPRPAMTALRNYSLELMGKDDMRTWQEALNEYVAKMVKERKRKTEPLRIAR
ncbi:MAG: dTDP-4-dehydrorhamnose reductase [Bacillota bacterium]|nr:dTDP-4-dehydrorhamnose reductase [Bacillota bacterium]